MQEYPKFLCRQGWDDLSDSVVVADADEEKAKRGDGYKSLNDAEKHAPESHPEPPKKRGPKPKAK